MLYDCIQMIARIHKSSHTHFFFFLTTWRIVPLGFLPWENRDAFPGGKPVATESCYPTYTVHAGCFSVSIIHRNSDMDHRSFSVRTDVNACDCTRGMYGHRKSLHWKLTLGEKSFAAPRNQTCVGRCVKKKVFWYECEKNGVVMVFFCGIFY